MYFTPIKTIIDYKQEQLITLQQIQKKYSNVEVSYESLGPIFITSNVNKIVNCFEKINENDYAFYIEENDIKIYGEPYLIQVYNSSVYENEWLTKCLVFNKQVLIKFMQSINSQYIKNVNYWKPIFPLLPEWIKKYG